MVQWLRLYTSNADVSGFILGWETKIPHALCGSRLGEGGGGRKRSLVKELSLSLPSACKLLGSWDHIHPCSSASALGIFQNPVKYWLG